MTEVEIKIGGRTYTVACDPGEETEVKSAAVEFDSEAQNILSTVGAVPETKLLLMAGLMLGGKLKVCSDSVSREKDQVRFLTTQIEELRASNPSDQKNKETEIPDATAKEKMQIEMENETALSALEDILKHLEDLITEPKEGAREQINNSDENRAINRDQQELF